MQRLSKRYYISIVDKYSSFTRHYIQFLLDTSVMDYYHFRAVSMRQVSGVRENHKLYEWIKGHQKK